MLDLLKQQEYSDYVRGDPADRLSPLTLTPAEQQAEEDYQKSTAQLVSLGEQWAELKKLDVAHPRAGEAVPAALRSARRGQQGPERLLHPALCALRRRTATLTSRWPM